MFSYFCLLLIHYLNAFLIHVYCLCIFFRRAKGRAVAALLQLMGILKETNKKNVFHLAVASQVSRQSRQPAAGTGAAAAGEVVVVGVGGVLQRGLEGLRNIRLTCV